MFLHDVRIWISRLRTDHPDPGEWAPPPTLKGPNTVDGVKGGKWRSQSELGHVSSLLSDTSAAGLQSSSLELAFPSLSLASFPVSGLWKDWVASAFLGSPACTRPEDWGHVYWGFYKNRKLIPAVKREECIYLYLSFRLCVTVEAWLLEIGF